MNTRYVCIALALAGILAASGCTPELPKTMVSLDQLVGEYNANAARVPRLWARAKIEVSVPTKVGLDYDVWGSTSFLAQPNALLLLFKGAERIGPQDFVIIGLDSVTEVFHTGCSIEDGAYYFWRHFGGDAALLWGRNRLAGAPGVKALPIDPLQILAVLGVCELPSDFSALPTVAMSMDTTPGKYAYVLTYMDHQPVSGRLLFRREVRFAWGDDKKRRPFRVDFFDSRGLRVMHAELNDYKPIELVGAPKGAVVPEMPTDIKITWERYRREGNALKKNPEASIHIILSEMKVDEKGGYPEACLLWDLLPDDIPKNKHIQVDRNVGLKGRKGAK